MQYLRTKLSIFMFIQCFTWGVWYVSMGAYLLKALSFTEQQVGAAYGAVAIGAMITPFFVGLVADRYFATERILAVLGVVGAVLLCVLAQLKTFSTFYPVLILYCTTYAPTLALANSLSLHHLTDSKRDFPLVKIFFSTGWIAGGMAISLFGGEQTPLQFYLAAGMSMVMGLFALTLPHTPPKKVGANVSIGEILGLDALAMFRKPSFAIFIGCMFLICIPLYFYFVNMGIFLTELGWENFAGKMTLGQFSDILFLLLLPFMLKKFGYKITIMTGMIAWFTRYFMLSASAGDIGPGNATAMIIAAIVVHGMCYDFLFVAGQLYVDGEATERNRGAAQGLVAFILWGVGAFVGTATAGYVMERHKLAEPVGTLAHDWISIWSFPAWGAVIVFVVFLLTFREPRKVQEAARAMPPLEAVPVGEAE